MQVMNMNCVKCAAIAFSLAIVFGCATAPDSRKVNQIQEGFSFDMREEQIETQREIKENLARLEKILRELDGRPVSYLSPNPDLKPAVENEMSNSSDHGLVEMKSAQHNLQASIDEVVQNGKENSRKMEELERKVRELEANLQHVIERLTSNKGLKQEASGFDIRKENRRNSPENPQEVSPEDLYDMARKAFGEQRYDYALDLWAEITTKFPNHELVPNAYFWQGEACYQLRDFAGAALKYEEVVNNYPESGKYPAAMLKQGLSLVAEERFGKGRALLQELIHKFPDTPEAKRAEIFLAPRGFSKEN